MKKILLATLALSLFAISACSSLNKAALAKVDRAAVVSIYVSRRVDMSNFMSLMGLASTDAQKDELKLDPVCEHFHETVFKYQEAFPFKYIAERDVIKAKGYRDIDAQYQAEDAKTYKTIEGYNVIQLEGSPSTIRQCFRVLPENTDAIMEFSIKYSLVKTASINNMVGLAKVEAHLDMIMYNRQGEEVMTIIKTGLSDDSFEFALDDFDVSKLNPLLPQANEKAFREMEEFIRKELRK